MNRWGAATALLMAVAAGVSLTLVIPVAAVAQGAGIGVEHVGPDTIALAPGARGSAAFRISSDGGGAQSGGRRVAVVVEAPEGWRLVAPSLEVTLADGEAVLRLVSFFVPRSAAPGLYGVSLAASDGRLESADSAVVRVTEVASLEASVESAPRWAGAGDRFQVTFRVTNSGNVPLPLEAELTTGAGVEATIESLPRLLEAGASVPVTAEVQAAEKAASATTEWVRLRVRGLSAAADVTARMEVVPSGRAVVNPRGSIPGEIRARLGSDARAGSPLRVSVAGPLRPGSETRGELLLSAPAKGHAQYGERDVYRLGLHAPRYTLRLGDHVYRLSPLTEPGRSGTGGEVRVRAGGLEVGGYAKLDRRSHEPDTQLAGFAALGMGDIGNARANWLRSGTGADVREVWSGETQLRLGGWGSIGGEYGFRPSEGADGRRVRVAMRRGVLALNASHVSGDVDFGGAYAGARLNAVTLGLEPWKDLYLRAAANTHSREGSPADASLALSTTSVRIAMGWAGAFGVEALERSRSAILAGDTSAGTARSIRVHGALPLGPLTLHPSAEIGSIERPPSAARNSFLEGRLHARVNVPGVSLSGSVEYSRGATLYRQSAAQRASAALSALLSVGPATSLELTLQGALDRAQGRGRSMFVSGRIEHEFAGGHRISVQGISRSAELGSAEAPLLILEYSLPFNLPGLASSDGESGAASITVVDAATGAPLPRVVVRLGPQSRATDGSGVATFRGVPAGVHFLLLDRRSAGVERVPTTPLPLPVDIEAGSTTEIEVGMARVAGLNTQVLIARASSAEAARGEIGEPEPLAGVQLEFTREDERIRRTTDATGRVELSDLRPGTWTVAPVGAVLPAFHAFSSESRSLEVAPGRTAEIQFLARPRQRRVRMVASEALSDSPSTATRVYLVTGLEPSLREVARKVYGNETLWPKIWLANCSKIPDPNMIRSGQTLVVPAGNALTREERAAVDAGGAGAGGCPGRAATRSYRVTGVEFSLREIAHTLYGDASLWPKIWYANRDLIPDPDVIRGGQVLTVPPKGPITSAEWEALEKHRSDGS